MAAKSFRELIKEEEYKRQTNQDMSKATYRDLVEYEDKYPQVSTPVLRQQTRSRYELRQPVQAKPLPMPTLEEQYRQTYSKPMPLAVDRSRMQEMIGNSLLEHTRQKNEAIKNFQPTLKPADRSYTQRALTNIPGRNVDLDLNFDSLDEDYEYEAGTKRPIVRLNDTNKKAFESYYDFPEDAKELEGQTMTYFSNLYGDKEGRQVLLTPIKPDGTVMSASDLKKYYNLITQDGPGKIKENDRYGLVMGVFDRGDEQANIREANEAAKMYSAYSQDSLAREGNAYKMQSTVSPEGLKIPQGFADPFMEFKKKNQFFEATKHDPSAVQNAKYTGLWQTMSPVKQHEFSIKSIDAETDQINRRLDKISREQGWITRDRLGDVANNATPYSPLYNAPVASDEERAKWEASLQRLRQMADDELRDYGQTDRWRTLLKTIDETKESIRTGVLPGAQKEWEERLDARPDLMSGVTELKREPRPDNSAELTEEAEQLTDRLSLLNYMKRQDEAGLRYIKVDEKYSKLWENKDFAEKSRFDESMLKREMPDFMGSREAQDLHDVLDIYQHLNSSEDEQRRRIHSVVVPGAPVTDPYELRGLDKLTPKEIKEFTYIFNTGEVADAKKYLDDKSRELLARRAADQSELMAGIAEDSPFFAYLAARAINLVKFTHGPTQLVATLAGADENDPIFDINRKSQVFDATNREAASKWFGGIKIPVLNTTAGEVAYGLMSSGVDSAVAIGTAMLLGGGQEAVNRTVQTIMSGGVLGDSLMEYKGRGLDDTTSSIMAMGMALLSAATEKYSLEVLFNSSGPFWAQVAKNFFAEMTEEQAESIGKRISENIALGDRNAIQDRINQLQNEDNMSPEKAKAQANKEWWQEFGVESIVSGLTGGIFGAAHWAGTRNSTNKAASNIVKKGNVGDLKVFAGRMGIETNINEQSSAQEVKKVTAQVYDQLIENAAAAKTPAEESAVSRDFQLFSGLTMSAQEKAEQFKAALEGMVHKAGQALEGAISEKTAEDLKKIASPLPGEAGELAKILDTKKPGLPADLIRSTIQALGERADVLIEAVKADITEKLNRMGEKVENSPAVAEAVMSYLTGQEQTAEQRQAIAGSEAGSKLVESLLIEEGRREMAARERAETEERERRDRAEYERVLASLEAEEDIQCELKAEVEKSPEKVRQVLTSFELARLGVAEEIVSKVTGAAKQVYELGQRAWNSQLEARKEAAKQTQLRMNKPGEGVVADHESVNRDSWTQEQRAAVALAEQIAKDSGYTLNIFQSAPVEGVYRAENGSYISEDGSIWLDVNAGKIREGDAGQSILPTFTHELVHHLLHAVPELGREYIGYTIDKMAEDGRDVVAKINEKIQRSIEARREIGIAKAIEEVVADSSNMMLKDSRAVEQMARKHPKLFSEIKNYIKDYVNRMREAFKRLSPVYDETKWLMKSIEGRLKYADEQVALFDRMMVAEAEARMSIEKVAPMTEPVRTAPGVQETAERVAGKGTAYTSDGQAVDYHYEAVPISGLVASNIESTMETNPAYPRELQPRDRTRAASRQQIDRIANNLNPGMLGASADVGTGAPMVGADMVVESGNGRILGLERAMRQGKASAYTQWLRENAAQFGLQAGDIQGDSVLVRVRDSEVDRVDFVRRANESQVAAYSDTESAATDAAKIKPGLLDLADMSGGEIDTAGNARFIARFVSEVVPKTEQGRMMDSEGKLSKTGEARIRNALFQLAYGDGYLTEQLAEATDAESRNMIRAMTGIAPRMAAMNTDMQRGLMHELDIGSQIAEAYRTVLRQKLAGVGVDEYLAQTTMLEELPKAQRMLLELFAEHKRSAVKMNDALDSVLDAVEAQGDPRQTGMLGDAGNPTVEGAIAEGLREFRAGLEDRQAASERYSVRVLPDGTKYVHVDTDQDLFDSVSADKYAHVARRYIIDNYSGMVIGTTNRAYVQLESANEYAYPAKKNMDPPIREAKLKAAPELPNIVEAGKFIDHAADDGRHLEAVRGWDYYQVIYEVGGRVFEGKTSIKKIDRGDVFYNVTQIKDITTSFAAKYGENPQYRDLGNASGMNIPETSPDSQGKVSRSERDGIIISKDGGVVVKDANALTSEEWAQVAKGAKRLGYDIRGAEDAKTLYSREGIIRLNDDVATIIKNIIGVPAETKTIDVEVANKHREAAIEEFGYTDYFYDAGFIMPDGEMLNFSGEKDKHFGMRGQDHRAIGVVFDEKLSGTDAMIAFMNEGNIRIMDESPGIDLSADVAPTDDQLWVIEEHVRESQGRENYYVDFSNSNGNSIGQYEYEGGVSPSRVVSDIKYFYRTGETRAMSDVQRFSFSERAYQAAVESKDMAEAQRLVDEAARAAGYAVKAWHGTDEQFFVFDPSKKYEATTRYVDGMYFSQDAEVANIWAKMRADKSGKDSRTIEAYLKFENPLILKWDEYLLTGAMKSNQQAMLKKIQENGHDAIIIGSFDEHYDGLFERAHEFMPNDQVPDDYVLKHDLTGDYLWKLKNAILNPDFTAKQIAVFNSEQIKSADPVTYDDSGKVIPLSERFNPESPDIRYAERERDMLTNREVLAGAFDLVSNSPSEKKNLADYKRLVRRLNNMEAEAAQLRAENRADRKAKADKAVIAERAARIADLEGRIDAADRRLLKMKDAAPLRNILKREGERVSRQAAEIYRARQGDYKASQADKKLRDVYVARIEKNATAMNTWLQRPDKKKYVNEAIRNNVADLLKAMNLSTVKPDGELRPSRRAKGWQEAMVSLSNLMHSMDMRSTETNMAILMDIDPDLAADVEALVRDNDNVLMPRAMPTDQLGKLDSIVRRMKRAITMANQMHTMGRGTLVETVAQGTIDYAEARREKKLRGNVVERLSTMLNLDMSDAFTYFESLGPDAQKVLKSLYNQGFGRLVRNTEVAQNFFKGLNEKYPGMASWSGKKATVQSFDVEGGTLYLTPGHIMELYLLNQREQARGHIYGRGLRIEGHEAGRGREHLYQKEAVRVSPADVARIIDTLTTEQRSAAEEFSSFLNTTMSDWGNEVSMTLYGYQKFIEGNYYPIRSDTSETLTRDPDTNFSMNALLNLGMTKSLTKNANNAIFIGDAFTTITKHITDMANYNAFAAPLTDAMKWFNYKQEGTNKSVKGSIERLHGRPGNAYFVNLLKAVNGIRTPTVATGFSGLLNSLAGKMKVAAVAGNARVIMQQHASYTRASAMISPAIMAQAYLRSPRRGMQMAQKYSPIAAWKHMGYFDMNIGRQMDALITGKESMTRKIQEATLMPAGVADDFTLGVLWNAAEIELGQSYEGDKRSEAFYELVGERLTDIIDRTQVVDTVFHRSQVMREKDGLIKITTNFMAEPIKTYNLLMSAIRTRDVGTIARTGAATLAGWITVAMAAGLIDVTRDKEKEKGWKGAWESYLSNVFGIDGNFWESNIWDELNILNMMPFAKEVYSMASGYSPSRPDMQAAQRIIWAGQNWMKLFEGTYDKSAYDLIYSTAAAISSTTGLPINNIMRDTVSVIDTVNPAIIGIAGGPSAKTILQRFASAMEAGKIDEAIAYYNTLIELGKTNENARDEMMKAAKLHPTIQAAAKALDEGRYADYEKLLVQEAWLPKEMAIRAARSLLGKEESEKAVSQKAESMDDIRGAMEYTAKTYTYQNSDLSALIESGKFVDVKRVIDSMMSEGKDKSTISKAITDAFKVEYVALMKAGKKSAAADLKAKILKAYELAGYDRAAKSKDIDKWVTDAQKKK